MDEGKVKEIVRRIAGAFPCSGQGAVSAPKDPISVARENRPLEFCLGVSVEEVIRFVLAEAEKPADFLQKRGDSTIVHGLFAGRALCGFLSEVPTAWPIGHTWVSVRDVARITCETCRVAAESKQAVEAALALQEIRRARNTKIPRM